MAIVNSMAIGKARKSVGNITLATVKGRTIAREKPAYVRNPNSPAQRAQRDKMAKIVAVWRSMGSKVGKLFTVIPGYGSAYNQFVKANIDKATGVTIDEMSGKITYPAGLIVGYGKYPENTLTLSKTADSEAQIIAVDDQMRSEAQMGDVIGVLYVVKSTGEVFLDEQVLASTFLDDFKAGRSVLIGSPVGADYLSAAFYFSPSRNISTTSLLKSLS